MPNSSSLREVEQQCDGHKLTGAKLGMCALLYLALLSSASVLVLRLPDPLPETAPSDQFSAMRAFHHVVELAKTPRPTGSEGASKARDYLQTTLRSLGLVSEQLAGISVRRSVVARVTDVIATIPGAEPQNPAVVLLAHYDSVAGSPGASDDASGVAVILETLRVLQTSGGLQNPVLAVFTDGEEIGSHGAHLFAEHYKVPGGIGVVLNFEARGTGGPPFLIEASGAEGALVRAVADTAPACVIGSVANDAYRMLPYDTDLSVFKTRGINGLNFSFFNGLVSYHASDDIPNALQLSTLQREGLCSVALARAFANSKIQQDRTGPVTYFRMAGLPTIVYAKLWAYIIGTATLVLVCVVLIRAALHARIRTWRTLIACLACGLAVAAVSFSVRLVWMGLLTMHPDYRTFSDEPYQVWIYWTALGMLAVAAFTTFYELSRRWLSVIELWAALLLVWAVAAGVALGIAPNSAYLLTWPLLSSVVGFAIVERRKEWAMLELFVASAFAIVPVLIVVPMVILFFFALSVQMIQAPVAMMLLVLGLLIPHLEYARRWSRWLLPLVSASAFVACCIAGAYLAKPSAVQRQRDSLFYAWREGEGAIWGSMDQRSDAWTRQFLGPTPEAGPCTAYLPVARLTCLHAPAPPIPAAAPTVTLLDQNKTGDAWETRFLIRSNRTVESMFLEIQPEAAVLSAEVDSKTVEGRRIEGWYRISYYGVPSEGIRFSCVAQAGQPLNLRVTDLSHGLPTVAGAGSLIRPNYLAPSGGVWSDALLTTSFSRF